MSQQSQHSQRKHAVVIGGSIAGMLAASVLAEHFERVTVLDRDTFSCGPEPRVGLPQARHIHVLLDAGRQALDRLLPNLIPDLVAAGAENYDAIADFECISPAGLCPRFPSEIRMLGATRDFIDWGIRQQLQRDQRIQIRTETKATELQFDQTAERVTGVIATKETSDQETEILRADLVVDASGRGSRTPQWLETHGYERPSEIVINGFLGYASQLVRLTADRNRDWKTFYIQAAPPERKRGGVIAAVENGKWIVTLVGGGKDYPPADESSFREFARSLPDPRFAEAHAAAQPISPIVATRSTENRLRRYETLKRRPEGLIVIGDAVCAFNPVYGQGMSAAAIGAVTLDECLKRHGKMNGLADRFQIQLANANARPWLLATGEDYRYREVDGPRPSMGTRVTHRYLDRVTARATRIESVHQRMTEVLHLIRSPASLFMPGILARVLFSRNTFSRASDNNVRRDDRTQH